MEITCLEDCYNAASIFGYPFMLKKRKLAYDGHGNYAIKNEEMINDGFNALGGCELYAEKWVPFSKEIAIMVVKTANGILTYPVVETIQKDNICHIVIAPAIIANNIVNDIKIMAELAVSSFEGYGIYGIELFLLPDDSVLLNEIAPR
jgi:phosphoribosylaminoimidazole carboxylase